MSFKNKDINISLANPRGFCAGVERAIEIVEKSIEKYGRPVYVRHEVVHNKFVINSLKEKGAIFTDNLDEVPNNSHIIFSAHGVSKKIKADSKKYNLIPIDATCPLVTKVHNEVNYYLKNKFEIIMIGHEGHPEVEGTLGQEKGLNKYIHLIQNEEDASNIKLKNTNKIAYVTQTTLSLDETNGIVEILKKRFPKLIGPKADDICYATQNRQDAIKKQIKFTDLLLVVGSQNSSNSNRLKEIGENENIDSYLIDDMNDFDENWLQDKHDILITAGASAPEILIKELVEKIKELSNGNIKEISGTLENISFKLPKI
jgi:4-hydroxy-3-methylbut-2-enyl diphosphate reductase